jgi:excinuclease ABC subunit C
MDLKELVNKLPTKPGVYQFLDAKENIIYIGKAKNLKSRVSSYFSSTIQEAKTLALVQKIWDIRYVVVDSEQDAFLLENNLIKKYKPHYNILLKDDKSYPWITITNELFPQVYITRRLLQNGAEYYGPYTSGKLAHLMIHLIKTIYKLRTCRISFTLPSIYAGKYKECLEAHLGNCAAPCISKISEAEYMEYISQIRNILKGRISSVIGLMNQRMNECADSLQFEQAQAFKESMAVLQNYQAKSTIVRPSLHNMDVFSYVEDGRFAYVNYLRIVHGAVNQVHSVELERRLDESKEAMLAYAIFDIRQMVNSKSKDILVPFYPDLEIQGARISIPQRGDGKKLIELSERNVLFFKHDRERQRGLPKKDESKTAFLNTIKNELKLPTLPRRIECFDNSNLQGSNPVAACVVFIDGKPTKKEYRHFHVKTVIGADDFASMEEIVYRRYFRRLDEGKELPDLIVIDGGKGQLHAALNSLEKLNIQGKVAIIGLAKRMEEIYYPADQEPYILGKNTVSLKTLMHIRNEAHRFGITFHRKLREKKQVDSVLGEIKGIGKETEVKLLQQFKSVVNIKNASLGDLVSLVGECRGNLVFRHFHEELFQE